MDEQRAQIGAPQHGHVELPFPEQRLVGLLVAIGHGSRRSIGQYTIFGDQKTTNNAGFDGYSRRSAITLLSNAQCAKGANYSTTWKLVEQPYELYNVVITGNAPSTNPTVTYNNAWDNAIQRTPQGNGGSILIGYDARSLSPNHFMAQEMDGNILQSIAINGKTITVTYKSEVSLTYILRLATPNGIARPVR